MNFRPAMGLFKESFRQLKIVGILGGLARWEPGR